jgi:hypothetical protein
MTKILKFDSFFEASLDLNVLADIRNGRSRGNVLIDKLKGDKKLKTNSNDIVTIDKMKDESEFKEPEEALDNITDTDGNYDIDKAKTYFKSGARYKDVFKDEDGKVYKLNQFKKDVEFGSKGAGRQVRNFESIQCLFLGIKQEFNISMGPVNLFTLYRRFRELYQGDDKNWHKSSHVKLPDIEINEEMIDDLCQDKDWLYTLYRIPNRLWMPVFNYLNREIKYNIYHVGNKDSNSPYIALYKKYKELASLEKFTDIDITKWCPADVYLIDTENQNRIISRISKVKNMIKLNSLIDELFDKKTLLPVSLKKISENTTPKIIINREIDKQLPDFMISEFIINDNPLRGIGSKISTTSIWKYRDGKNVDRKNRLLNLDSSNTSKKQNIDAEVEGSTSRHGKISLKAIKRMIDSYSLEGVQEIQSFDTLSKLNIDELKELATTLTNSIKEFGFVKTTSSNRSSDISNTENKLISKIQSLQVVLFFCQVKERDNNISNSIITKIMRYALSIQTDKFDTPRYLRVI